MRTLRFNQMQINCTRYMNPILNPNLAPTSLELDLPHVHLPRKSFSCGSVWFVVILWICCLHGLHVVARSIALLAISTLKRAWTLTSKVANHKRCTTFHGLALPPNTDQAVTCQKVFAPKQLAQGPLPLRKCHGSSYMCKLSPKPGLISKVPAPPQSETRNPCCSCHVASTIVFGRESGYLTR